MLDAFLARSDTASAPAYNRISQFPIPHMLLFHPISLPQIPIIRQIAWQTWPHTFGELMSMEQVHYMLDLIYSDEALTAQMTEKGHRFILAENEGVPLGFTSYETDYAGEPKLMIHKLYLLPQSQGLGVGTKFIDHLSSIALENNNHMLQLLVFHKNIKAIGFYERIGFVKKGTVERDIGSGYVVMDYVMVKDLH